MVSRAGAIVDYEVPKEFVLAFSREEIASRIASLARDISGWASDVRSETGKDPLAVCILRGAVFFFSDLLCSLNLSVEPSFCRTWSYSSETNVQEEHGVRVSVENIEAHGRAILMVDDICDTGATLLKLHNVFYELEASDVKSVVLIRRMMEKSVYEPTWSCFEYPGAEWFVGYGMEDKNRYSNLPEVYKIASFTSGG